MNINTDDMAETRLMFRALARTRWTGSGHKTQKTEAQLMGAVNVAILLAVAQCGDRGLCATPAQVAEIAGVSRGSAGKWLALLDTRNEWSWLAEYDARGNQCGDAAHRRSHHYRTNNL